MNELNDLNYNCFKIPKKHRRPHKRARVVSPLIYSSVSPFIDEVLKSNVTIEDHLKS